MMNDKQLDKKVRKDAAQVRKDLSTLLEDSATRISRFEKSANQASGKVKENITTWVEDGVSHLTKRLEKMAGDAHETGVSTATAVRKDVGQGLRQYNAKAQDIANQFPDGFGKKIARYPWVPISITIVMAVLFLLGILLQPSPQTVAQA